MSKNTQPPSASASPRFCNMGNFMRLPHANSAEGLDFAIVGIPFDQFERQFELPEPIDKEQLLAEVKVSGLDIVELKGYTSSGIALSVCRLIGAIMRNERAVVPASVVLNGEYGLRGVAMSLPCVISRNGIERTLQIPLDEEGQEKLKACYEYLHEVIESIS